MFCRYCGKEIKNSKPFCPYCGKQLAQPSSTPADSSVNKNKTTTAKGKKRFWPVLVCLVFVMLAAFGTVAALVHFEILDIPGVSDFVDGLRENQQETEDSAEESDTYETTAPANTEGPQAVETDAPAELTETIHIHSWMEATYTAPSTCSGCGLTEGLSLGTALTDCTVTDHSNSSKGTDILTGSMTDVAGAEYEDAVTFWVNAGGGYVNTEHVVYLLSGQYDVLNGVIAVSNKSDQSAAIRFYIYGDNTLLYTSNYIRGTETENVEIDVSGVQELRVECETDEICQSYGMLCALLFVG